MKRVICSWVCFLLVCSCMSCRTSSSGTTSAKSTPSGSSKEISATSTPDISKEADLQNQYDGPYGTNIPLESAVLEKADIPGPITHQEAYQLLAEQIRPEESTSLLLDGKLSYLLMGSMDYQGTTCYQFGFGESTEKAFSAIKEYLVSITGVIYEVRQGDVPEYEILFSPPEIAFEANKDILSDPPEGKLSVFEAQKYLEVRVLLEEGMELLESEGLYYLYQGIKNRDGAECYSIDLCKKSESETESVTIRSYLVSNTGEVYQNNTGESSEASWWGEYHSESGALGITNFNGRSFLFTFLMNDGTEYNGAAPVYEENPFKAEYMDLTFSLDETSNMIIVSQEMGMEDELDRAGLTGEYNRP